MPLSLDELLDAAARLDPGERARLAHGILLLCDGGPSAESVAIAWDAETARRIAELDAGTVVPIPADEVWQRLSAGRRANGD